MQPFELLGGVLGSYYGYFNSTVQSIAVTGKHNFFSEFLSISIGNTSLFVFSVQLLPGPTYSVWHPIKIPCGVVKLGNLRTLEMKVKCCMNVSNHPSASICLRPKLSS